MKIFQILFTVIAVALGSHVSAEIVSHVVATSIDGAVASDFYAPFLTAFATGGTAVSFGMDLAGSLAMALSYSGLTGRTGVEDNIGGLTKRFWFAPKSYFTTIEATKDLSDPTATLASLTEISADHVFDVTKGFHMCYCTRDMGEIKWSGAGERDGRSMPGKANFFVPGLATNNLGIVRMLKNDELIILAELADGKVIQLGSERFPAEMRVSEGGSAKNESGVRGLMLEVDFFESGPQVYTGTIDLHP